MGKNIIVHNEDDVSEVLFQRWIACFMVRDRNLRHASFAFDNGEYYRWKKVCQILGRQSMIPSEQDSELKNAYNRVLCEEIEGSIKEYVEIWNEPRCVVELTIAEIMAEVFSHK